MSGNEFTCAQNGIRWDVVVLVYPVPVKFKYVREVNALLTNTTSIGTTTPIAIFKLQPKSRNAMVLNNADLAFPNVAAVSHMHTIHGKRLIHRFFDK